MWKKIIQFLPSLSLWIIGVGLQVSGTEIPILGYALIVLGFVLLIIPLSFFRQRHNGDVKKIIRELLSVGIYTDVPVNILRILYHDRKKLTEGLSNEATSVQDKLVLAQLNLRNVVKLEQRKVKIYGSDNVREEGYWTLTEFGKEVIAYLEKNPQVLHKEGSVSK